MATTNQWVRLVEIDRRVRAGEYPGARSLALALGVDERMIYRDRLKLLAMGAPIVFHHKRGGWCYRDATWVLPAVHLSEGELLAFFLSVEIARSIGNTGFGEALSGVVAKIAATASGPVSVDLNELRAATSFGLSPAARVDAATCQALCSAQSRRQKVKMHYFTASRGQSSERVVHPYLVRWLRGEWFLIAWDENRGAIRCFNIARVTQFEPLASNFVISPAFNAETYIRTMFCAEAGETTHQVRVWFDAYQARYIAERDWHPQQHKQPLPDGGLLLEFPASGLQEVARWVLGYGRHARALAPPELVALVREHLCAMTPGYEQGASAQEFQP